jgi:chromosome segregation ATPase
MFWCLLASAICGGLIGWGIKGLLASARDRAAEERNRAQITAHQGQLRQETERYRALEGEHAAAVENVRTREKEVLGLGESIRTLTESRDAATNLRTTALKELESSKGAYTALQGDLGRVRSDLEAQLEAAKADARKHEASVADYSKRLTETTGFLNQSKHALEVHQKDYDDLVARHRLVEALPTTVKAQEETIAALRKQVAEAQTASNEARLQRENVAKEKSALDVRVAELNGQVERSKQELSGASANHATALQGKTQAENNLTQKIAAFVALEASMLALRKQSDADAESWKSKFAAGEQAATGVRQQLAEKSKQYDTTHAELLQARTQLESARRDTGTAQQRVAQLEAAARTAGGSRGADARSCDDAIAHRYRGATHQSCRRRAQHR